MQIFRNVIIKKLADDGTSKFERVIWLDRRRDLIAVFALDNSHQFPQIHRFSEYEGLLCEGKTMELSEPFQKRDSVLTSNLTPKQIAARDTAWSVICDIVEAEPDVFFSERRTPMIKEAMAKYRVNRIYVVRKMMLYWKHGMSINALATADYDKGGRGKARKYSSEKRGRPYKSIGINNVGKDITYIDKNNIIRALDRHYLIREAPTLRKAYRLMLSESYGINFQGEIPDRGSDPKIPFKTVPSYNSFCYWARKFIDPVEAILKRNGKLDKRQNHSPVLGNQTSHAEGPGAIYQIDATIADLYLLDDTRTHPLGRPVLYMVVDTWTHCVAGIYVGFKAPSWDGAMMALYNCTLNKVEYCKSLGLPIVDADWPVQGLCRTIQADRGEFASSKPQVLKDTLGIEVRLCAAGMAKWKGIVESKFRSINNTDISWIREGKVQKHRKPRLEPDLRKEARFTLREFERFIVNCVLEYNSTKLRDYPVQEWMRTHHVDPVPQALWIMGTRHQGGFFGKHIPQKTLMVSLMHHKKATINKHGLVLFKRRYINSDDMTQDYYTRTRIESQEVRVSYDPRDITHVYVITDEGIKEYVMLDDQQGPIQTVQNKLLSEQEINAINGYDNERDRDNVERKNRLAVMTESALAEIKRAAFKDELKTGNMANRKSTDIRANRKKAQKALDDIEKFPVSSTPTSTATAPIEPNDEFGLPAYDEYINVI